MLRVMAKRYPAEFNALPSTGERESLASNLPAKNGQASIAGIKIETILAPTDLSPTSKAGIRHALKAAKELDARVIVHYAITAQEIASFGRKRSAGAFVAARFNGLLKICEERLRRFLMRHFADDLKSVEIKLNVEFGTPEKSIIAGAESEGADVIIMSTSGRRRLAKWLLGSVTERIVRNAPCPVLAIPADKADVARTNLRSSGLRDVSFKSSRRRADE